MLVFRRFFRHRHPPRRCVATPCSWRAASMRSKRKAIVARPLLLVILVSTKNGGLTHRAAFTVAARVIRRWRCVRRETGHLAENKHIPHPVHACFFAHGVEPPHRLPLKGRPSSLRSRPLRLGAKRTLCRGVSRRPARGRTASSFSDAKKAFTCN